jgi:hypothetical protein
MDQPTTGFTQEGGTPATMIAQNGTIEEPSVNGDSRSSASTSSTDPNYSETTISEQSIREVSPPVLRLLRAESLAFQRLEQRDGVVLEVDPDARTFRARLVDPSESDPDQEVELELDQVSLADVELVRPGAFFFWAIGYVTRGTGRRNLVLSLDFRRLAVDHDRARQDAESAAERYLEDMNWS